MTEVIRLDAVTSVSSVCLSSNNVPRAFSSKWRAGLEGPVRRWRDVCQISDKRPQASMRGYEWQAGLYIQSKAPANGGS